MTGPTAPEILMTHGTVRGFITVFQHIFLLTDGMNQESRQRSLLLDIPVDLLLTFLDLQLILG